MPHRVQERAAHAEHQPGREHQEQPGHPVRAESLERQAEQRHHKDVERADHDQVLAVSGRSPRQPGTAPPDGQVQPCRGCRHGDPVHDRSKQVERHQRSHDEPDPNDADPRLGRLLVSCSVDMAIAPTPERTPAAPSDTRDEGPHASRDRRRSAVTVQHGQRTSSSPINDDSSGRWKATTESFHRRLDQPCSDRRRVARGRHTPDRRRARRSRGWAVGFVHADGDDEAGEGGEGGDGPDGGGDAETRSAMMPARSAPTAKPPSRHSR